MGTARRRAVANDRGDERMKKRPAWRTGSIPVRSDTIHLIGQVPLHTHQQLRDYLAKSEALAVELSADDAHGFAIFAAVSGSDAALEKGQFEEAVAIARQIEQIKAQLTMKPAAEKGRKFPGGSRPGRQNALSARPRIPGLSHRCRARTGRASWHTYRRTFSTWSHDAGIPGKVTAELMGHANVMTTMNIYTQVLPGAVRETAGRIEGNLFAPHPGA